MDNQEIVVLFPAETESFFFFPQNAQTGCGDFNPGGGGGGSRRDVKLTVYLHVVPS
jgi:hypothetical protein